MKNVLIIGLGTFGMCMAERLMEDGHEVLGIDSSEARADDASCSMQQVLIGDATDEHFMKGIGVSNFDFAVVAIGDNFQTALEITVLLKDLGCKFVIARAAKDVHKKLLLRNGADHVVYAEREVAERLAITYGADNIFDYLELSADVAIYEISVPLKWLGKDMIELDIRNKYHVSVLATKQDGVISALPSPKHIFTDSESLLVMGNDADIRKLK